VSMSWNAAFTQHRPHVDRNARMYTRGWYHVYKIKRYCAYEYGGNKTFVAENEGYTKAIIALSGILRLRPTAK